MIYGSVCGEKVKFLFRLEELTVGWVNYTTTVFTLEDRIVRYAIVSINSF